MATAIEITIDSFSVVKQSGATGASGYVGIAVAPSSETVSSELAVWLSGRVDLYGQTEYWIVGNTSHAGNLGTTPRSTPLKLASAPIAPPVILRLVLSPAAAYSIVNGIRYDLPGLPYDVERPYNFAVLFGAGGGTNVSGSVSSVSVSWQEPSGTSAPLICP